MRIIRMSAPVIIIGATGGIGSALARQLSVLPRPLHLIARDSERLSALASELGATSAVANVLDSAALQAAISAADAGEGVAGLAYCVGSIPLKPLKATKPTDFIEAFSLNTLGAAEAIKIAEPGLRKAKGAVVLFSTVAVAQGFTNHSVIAAAKGAVEGMARALAAEMAPDVRVNVIAPSLTRTPLASSFTSNPAMAQGIAALHGLGRLGEADDSASLAAYLLGPQAGWITGQVIGVDGGRATLRTKG